MDRRKSPRIKVAHSDPGFVVTLIVKRLFLPRKEVICKIRDFSEGGALLAIVGKGQITKKDNGRSVTLKSVSRELQFLSQKNGKISRIIEDEKGISVVIQFSQER